MEKLAIFQWIPYLIGSEIIKAYPHSHSITISKLIYSIVVSNKFKILCHFCTFDVERYVRIRRANGIFRRFIYGMKCSIYVIIVIVKFLMHILYIYVCDTLKLADFNSMRITKTRFFYNEFCD